MVIIINGASGAGKTFLLENLTKLNNKKLVPIKKYTTRTTRSFENSDKSVDLIYNHDAKSICRLDYHYTYNNHLYGIDKNEIIQKTNEGMIPVIIIRSFETIKMIRSDFPDTKVLFIVGATGETLKYQLGLQGRTDEECAKLQDAHLEILKDYVSNIDIIDACIINCLYDECLFLEQLNFMV